MPDFVRLYVRRGFGYTIVNSGHKFGFQYYIDPSIFGREIILYIRKCEFGEIARFEISEFTKSTKIAVYVKIHDKDDFLILLSDLFSVDIDCIRFSIWTDSIEIDLRESKAKFVKEKKDSEDIAILAIRGSIQSLTICQVPFDRKEEEAVSLLRRIFVQPPAKTIPKVRRNELSEYVRF